MKRIFGAVIGTALLVGPLGYAIASTKSADTYKQLDLFADVFEVVRNQYVEPVTDNKLVEGAINGMLSALDPHSNYMNEKEFTDLTDQTKGEFGGLGLEVNEENGLIKVVSPIDDTPAQRANIKSGDFITHVDGEPIVGVGINDAVAKMRGKPGTSVKLTLRHVANGEPFDVTLTREIIKVASVKARVEGDIGYIRISQFTEQTQPGLDKAITDIKQQLGPKLAGYVLDLRDNPGGLLNSAESVASTFIDKGEIVSTRGRNADDVEHTQAKAGMDMTKGVPMVTLINGGSASASEIVAGALQDHHRAIIMGTQSFGKAVVQTIMPLKNKGALKLTTAYYFTPSGRSIQEKGITPDIEVKAAKIEEIDQAGRLHEADLKGALANPNDPAKPAAGAPASRRASTAAAPALPARRFDAPRLPAQAALMRQAGDDAKTAEAKPAALPVDYQLARALDLLHGVALFNNHAVN